jgi:TolB-like protein
MNALGTLSRERWQLLEPLLDAALELDPEKRPDFLDAAGVQDPSLREELRALLASCELGESILAMPAAVRFAPLLAHEADEMPTLLGDRYHIVREIARGGMATIYLADDPKHARQVAVKALHRDVARLIGRERFAQEIEIAAGLSHPYILPLHDSGEEDTGHDEPLLYFVAPFADGESLRARLEREQRLPPNEVVRLGRQVALALDYAHRRGVIHLDIKPENILLQEGHALVADFGIARAMCTCCEEEALETSVPIFGTPRYMSPEQALGLFDVDGRSDVYSLGCVLYELLTGIQPFARAASDEGDGRLPRIEALELYSSRELGEVVMKAIAPNRDDRYATAGELAAALSSAARQTRQRRWRSARVTAIGGTLLGIASALGIWAAGRNTALDGHLIAVAPFDVAAPSLSLWREGLVDVLSRSIDGAGSLHTVSASDVIRNWHGRADLPSAQALGQATGARFVLFGGLLSAGDSVRATVNLLDVKTGRTIAEIEQRDLTDRIDRLSDSLTVAALRELGESRPVGLANAASWPTTSLAALKAYLHGEQFYRAALWDSAQVSFERALMLDTTFGLAYHRLAAVRRWRDTRDVPDSTTYALMRWPSRFPRGLGARERLLATIDSLSAEAHFAWRRGIRDANYVPEESLVHRLYSTLETGLRRYPNDAELWFLLAEAHTRFDADVGVGEINDRATLALYDHAIALDSTFAPAYVRPIALAAYLDGAASARRYILAYLRLAPSGPHSEILRVADLLLDPARAPSIDVARLVDTLPPDMLCDASRLLRHAADSAEMVVSMGRALSAAPSDPAAALHRATCTSAEVADGLQFRGHLRDAYRLTTLQVPWQQPAVAYNMSRVGMLTTDSARAEFNRVLALAPRTRMTKLYRWWATDGDTAAIQTYIRGFIDAERVLKTPSGYEMLQASAAAGRAYLALAKGDTSGALAQFVSNADTLHECWYDSRMTVVELLIAAGRYRDAAARLERRWPGTSGCSNGFDDVMWTLTRARVLERLGRRDEAASDYAFVAQAWRTADSEIQPYVRESTAALARLRGFGN